jgi:hypothetical protein
MADEPIEQPEGDEEILELTEEVDAPEEGEQVETAAQGDDEDEFVITIGDEAPPASSEPESSTIRDMRQALREKEAKIKELEQRSKPQEIEVGPKPTLESCEYDEERFERDYNAYLDRKASAERVKSEAQKAEENAQAAYRAKVEAYGEQKQSLIAMGAKDFDIAEKEVLSNFSDDQQALMLRCAGGASAKLVLALGRHPAKLRELASITDPGEFVWKAAQLEGQTKMERRKPATTPESRVSGSGQLTQEGKLSDKLSAAEWARRRTEQVRKPR